MVLSTPFRILAAHPALAVGVVALIAAGGCALPGDHGPAEVVAQGQGALQAGCARVEITPRNPVKLAGFGLLRTSVGVHDPLFARALALRCGEATVVLVSCDVIGLHFTTVEQVRALLADVIEPGAVLVASSHTHSGPDTLGLWGFPPLLSSGVDDAYLEALVKGVSLAARRALGALEPATLSWGQAEAPVAGVSYNRRDMASVDRTVTALALDRADGSSLATLVHFACHPEVLGSDNLWLSSDFVGPLCAAVEAKRPGIALYLNGAQGAMVTTHQSAHTFEEAQRIGGEIARVAHAALEAPSPVPAEPQLLCVRTPLQVPVDNWRYSLADWFGVLPGREFSRGRTPSELWGLRLGPWVVLSAPGEAVPRLGVEFSEGSPSQPFTLAGLGNDELGYLLHEDHWENPRYRYERTVSPSLEATALVREAGFTILEALDAQLAPTPRAE